LSQFFGLPFLPAEEIENCFAEDIMSEAPSDEKYTAFPDYVLGTYGKYTHQNIVHCLFKVDMN
jgi:hypothetical protein